jgi:Holliday junction DNA helicase RuvA
MIVSLRGTLLEALPTGIVLEVAGVGYALSVSSTTASALPAQGTTDVRVLVRMVVRDSAIELFGFASVEERAVFDRLVAVTGVGPRLALSVLSTYGPQELARIVADSDVGKMAKVPGVGKKTASRLVLELAGVFSKDPILRALEAAEVAEPQGASAAGPDAQAAEAAEALLAMGFTQQEAELALEGARESGASTTKSMLSFALRRLGGGR